MICLALTAPAHAGEDPAHALDGELHRGMEPQPARDGAEKRVWDLLSLHDAIAIDSLLSRVSLPASEVYSALLSLETLNLIRQLPGNKYVRRL